MTPSTLYNWPDGQVREEAPYRCGAFYVATGEQCTKLSDHDGAHRFAEPDGFMVVVHVRRGGCNASHRLYFQYRESAEIEADRRVRNVPDVSFAQVIPLYADTPDGASSRTGSVTP